MDATKIIRPSISERVFCAVVYIVGLAFLAFTVSERYWAPAVGAFAVLGGLWLADVWLTRIVLRNDGAWFMALFRPRFVPRSEIADVTWQKGCGAALQLVDGTWVKLPNAGRNAQGLSNTIRAWLKRTDAPA